MEKSTLKKLESVAHIALGFVAGIMNLRLLLTYRERHQLPPENALGSISRGAKLGLGQGL